MFCMGHGFLVNCYGLFFSVESSLSTPCLGSLESNGCLMPLIHSSEKNEMVWFYFLDSSLLFVLGVVL